MKTHKLARILFCAIAVGLLAANRASGAEARPWLCRDKPVFSYERSMEYQVTARPGHQWRIYFMQFSPDAAHDGFEIVNQRAVPADGAPAAGRLDAGRYYAVALYLQGGHWICPGYAHDDRQPKLGEVSNLCYAEDEPPCLVNLSVKPGHNPAAPGAPQAR